MGTAIVIATGCAVACVACFVGGWMQGYEKASKDKEVLHAKHREELLDMSREYARMATSEFKTRRRWEFLAHNLADHLWRLWGERDKSLISPYWKKAVIGAKVPPPPKPNYREF